MAIYQRQCDEFAALEAIHEGAFRDCTSSKPAAWKNVQPLKECRIAIHALEDDLKDRVSLVLHVKSVQLDWSQCYEFHASV
jgi:hypothetical protein